MAEPTNVPTAQNGHLGNTCNHLLAWNPRVTTATEGNNARPGEWSSQWDWLEQRFWARHSCVVWEVCEPHKLDAALESPVSVFLLAGKERHIAVICFSNMTVAQSTFEPVEWGPVAVEKPTL